MGKDLNGKELGEGFSQRKDGRYTAKFRAKNGKRIEGYFNDLEDAKVWMINAKYKEEHNSLCIESKMPVDQWFRFWLDEIKGDTIRHGTRVAYQYRYNARIKDVIGNMPLKDVRPLHCQMVINKAQQAGECEYSVKKARVIMKAFFEAAVDNMLLDHNPVTKQVKVIHQEKEEPRVLTKEEQIRFLNAIDSCEHADEFRFILETGMRGGEMMGLTWDNVDFDNRRIMVANSLEYRTDMKEFVNNPPKTKNSARMIPMTENTYRILKKRFDSREERAIIPRYANYVFLNRNGKPTHRAIYNRILRSKASELGIPSFSLHTLRHTFATRCIEAGIRPKTLQKMLGHSELRITMDLYVHVTNDEIESEMKKFEQNLTA